MSDKLKVMKDYLKVIDEVIEKGPYKADTWNTMLEHKVPDWYQNAKFGIFIHWGVFSVPAYDNEWYPRFMYRDEAAQNGHNCYQHHIDTYGPHKEFGYKDFVPMFKAEKFDAAEWAELFKDAGAKFVMPVAEHHDGFQMYNSDISDWNAVQMGPKKDIVGLLKEEIEKRDMVLTTSSHRVEHYWFMSGGKSFDSDMPQDIPYGHMYWPSIPDPYKLQSDIDIEYIDPLFMEDWLVRTCELADKYHPKIMYFDWWIQVEPMKPYLKKFMAYYYNRALEWGEEVTINYKNDAYMHSTAVKDIERGQLSGISPRFWQNDTSVAKNSWCYTEGNDYKKPYEVIGDLVDVVSKNGSLLLNIGPKSDGSIPEEDANILREVGKWLQLNGEAIYGTTHWRKYGEGPTVTQEGHFTDTLRKDFTSEDFRFTFRDGILYVFAMNWPQDGIVRIKTLSKMGRQYNASIKSIEVLGGENTRYTLCDEHLTVQADGINTKNPVCIKIIAD